MTQGCPALRSQATACWQWYWIPVLKINARIQPWGSRHRPGASSKPWFPDKFTAVPAPKSRRERVEREGVTYCPGQRMWTQCLDHEVVLPSPFSLQTALERLKWLVQSPWFREVGWGDLNWSCTLPALVIQTYFSLTVLADSFLFHMPVLIDRWRLPAASFWGFGGLVWACWERVKIKQRAPRWAGEGEWQEVALSHSCCP